MAISGLKLNCTLDECDLMTVTAPSGGYTQGDFVLVGKVVGIVAQTVAAGKKCALIIRAPRITLPCTTVVSGGSTQGTTLYYKSSTKKLDTSSTSNTKCAHVLVQPAKSATEVEVNFIGWMSI